MKKRVARLSLSKGPSFRDLKTKHVWSLEDFQAFEVDWRERLSSLSGWIHDGSD